MSTNNPFEREDGFITNMANYNKSAFYKGRAEYYDSVKEHHILEIKDTAYYADGRVLKDYFAVYVTYNPKTEKDLSVFWKTYGSLVE